MNKYTIERAHKNIWLCLRGTYGPSSVLAGEDFRQLVKPYNTLEEAVAENPNAEVDLDAGYEPSSMSDIAPDWFDPSAAGETWNEED